MVSYNSVWRGLHWLYDSFLKIAGGLGLLTLVKSCCRVSHCVHCRHQQKNSRMRYIIVYVSCALLNSILFNCTFVWRQKDDHKISGSANRCLTESCRQWTNIDYNSEVMPSTKCIKFSCALSQPSIQCCPQKTF